ncbi:amino acid adenylation domain-containing protein [Photobacterium sp. DNB22_13_2]
MMSRDLLAAIHQQFNNRPEAVAIEWGGRMLSYQQLAGAVAETAGALRRGGQAPVAFFLEPCPALVVNLTACLFTGHVFAPLNPMLPDPVLRQMLTRVAPSVIMTIPTLAERTYALAAQLDPVPEVRVCDPVGLNMGTEPLFNPWHELESPRWQDPCYIYFTSGSTGDPKPILGSYRGLSHFVMWQQTEFAIGPQHRVGQVTLPAFDPFLREVLLPLVAGAVLVLPEHRELILSEQLPAWVNQNEISVLHMVPTLFRQNLLHPQGRSHPLSLDYLFLAGEPLRGRDVAQFYQCYGEGSCQLVNLYGPTETTLAKVFKRLGPDDMADDLIPIGRPLDEQVKVHVLDERGQHCDVGQPGELVIETELRSYGYLGLKEENRRSFRRSPPYYFTGDMGKLRPDGQLVCLGRKDNQIKLRGVRADLLGIESVIEQAPGVAQCVVRVQDEGLSTAQLQAFVVLASNNDAGTMLDYTNQHLNQALVPAKWIQVEALPQLPNGKVNRKKVHQLVGSELQFAPYRAPVDEDQRRLVAIWQQVLQQQRVGMDDHFFRRGGHSLQLMSLKTLLEQAFSVSIEPGLLFTHLTPASQLAYLQTRQQRPETYTLEQTALESAGPVSVLQRNIILAHQFHRQDSSYNLTRVIELNQPLDSRRLELAMAVLTDNLPLLRSTFVIEQGEVRTQITPVISVPVESYSLAGGLRFEDSLSAFVRPFELEVAPLLRVGLWEVSATQAYLALDIHHSLVDGISVSHLLAMLLECYQGRSPAEPAWHYHDYVSYNLKQQALHEPGNIAYWKTVLSPLPEPLQLASGHDRPIQFDGRAEMQMLEIGSQQLRHLQQLAQHQGCTLFVLLYAAYSLVLQKISGQNDMVIGVPVAGRDLPEVAEMPGVFMRVLPLRTVYSAESSLTDYLMMIQQNFAAALAHQDFAFENLVEALKIPRSANRQPLFDTLFALHDGVDWQDGELSACEVHVSPAQAKADLAVDAYLHHDALTVTFTHAEAMLDSGRVTQLVQYMATLLMRITEHPPSQSLRRFDRVPVLEQVQLLEQFNQTTQAVEGRQTLVDRFHQQVDLTPEREACRSAGVALSYRELDQRANQLAHALLVHGRPLLADGEQGKVAIMIAPSVELAVAIWAVLKAGMAYVPLDPDFPVERLQFMVKDAGITLMLTDQNALAEQLFHGPVLAVEERAYPKYPTTRPEGEGVNQKQLAYLIYTSGSTGQPKGVMIEHGAAVNFLNGMERALSFNDSKTVLALTTFSFDIFVLEFFLPLLKGARLVIATRRQQQDMAELSMLIGRAGITTLQFTPSRMKMFLAYQPALDCFAGVEEVLMGGEYVGIELVDSIRGYCSARVFNMYGPTETTVWSAVGELTCATQSKVGIPIDNTQLYVLDEQHTLCPLGTLGELYIAGQGLARGYHQLPEKTAKAFVDNPFRSGQRMYRTGDLAYWLPSGELVVCGRIDSQVKIKGHRIELHEVEDVLKWYPGIQDAVCLVRERRTQGFSESYLCAFYQAVDPLEEAQLRHHIRTYLPEYMVPEAWRALDTFPLTANGKIDRKAFPQIVAPATKLVPAAADLHATPFSLTPTEQIIYRVWSGLLPVAEPGLDDNFFELGGNSLHVVFAQKALAEQGINVSAITILEQATISHLANWVDSQQPPRATKPCRSISFAMASQEDKEAGSEWEYSHPPIISDVLVELSQQLGVMPGVLLAGLHIYALAAVTEQTQIDVYIGVNATHCHSVSLALVGIDNLPDFIAAVADAVVRRAPEEIRNFEPHRRRGQASVYIAAANQKALSRNTIFDLVLLFDCGGTGPLRLQGQLNHKHISKDTFTAVGQVLNGLITQLAQGERG